MLFKGLKFGKKKDKEKENPTVESTTKPPIEKLEAQLRDRTDGLAQTEKRLKRLSDKVSELGEPENVLEHPHRPLGELSIEPVDSLSGVDTDEQEDIDVKHEIGPEDENLAEFVAEPQAETETEAEAQPQPKPLTSTKKVEKGSLDADSLKALFASHEEEENPLKSLINSLPDISIDELMDDLKEIKDIIRDWQKK